MKEVRRCKENWQEKREMTGREREREKEARREEHMRRSEGWGKDGNSGNEHS